MAAGLGFKDFTTGEVLTAADVDGYLMQGVWVFADAAARDAAVTSPQEGNFAYLKDTNVTTYYTGSAWANLDTTGMTNPMTTTGDTIYSSSGSTPARLGIGSTGQVLTVSGGLPTWSTPAGSSENYSLINAGGTAMSGSSTVTVSGISGKNSLLFMVEGADAPASSTIQLRLNTDSGANYFNTAAGFFANPSYIKGIFTSDTGSGTSITLCVSNSGTGNYIAASGQIRGCNTSGIKTVSYEGACDEGTNNFIGNGRYEGTSTISSISIISSAGNFTQGTLKVYGSA